MKWFKHDSDANRDPKLEKVLMKYGAEGYALYWMCLEAIAAPIDSHNLSFELEHDAEILAYRLRVDSNKVEEIMNYMVNLGLFEMNETTKIITCMKLAKRIENSIIKNPELKQIQSNIRDNPGTSGPDKIRLDQNTKPIKKRGFTPPSLNEVSQYCKQRGNKVDPETFVDFYSSKGWMVGKTKMKDWQASIRTWEKREAAEKKGAIDWDELARKNARPGESMAEFKRRWKKQNG